MIWLVGVMVAAIVLTLGMVLWILRCVTAALAESHRTAVWHLMAWSSDQREAMRIRAESESTELLLRDRRAKDRAEFRNAPHAPDADDPSRIDYDARAVFPQV